MKIKKKKKKEKKKKRMVESPWSCTESDGGRQATLRHVWVVGRDVARHFNGRRPNKLLLLLLFFFLSRG